MKFLKAVFTNALVLATLVTSLAGTILLAYAADKPRHAVQAYGVSPKAEDGFPQHRVGSTERSERVASTREQRGKTPPIIFWGTEIPGGSYIDALL
jgi:hypothetical protein